jgi:hypothetical protein
VSVAFPFIVLIARHPGYDDFLMDKQTKAGAVALPLHKLIKDSPSKRGRERSRKPPDASIPLPTLGTELKIHEGICSINFPRSSFSYLQCSASVESRCPLRYVNEQAAPAVAL